MLPTCKFSFAVYFMLINPVLSDHMTYVNIFQCSLTYDQSINFLKITLNKIYHHALSSLPVLCLLVFSWCVTPLSTIFQLYRSVLLVEETGGPYQPATSHWQTLSHNVVHLSLSGSRIHNISGDRHWLQR